MSTGVLTICFGTALALAVFVRRKDPVRPKVNGMVTGFLLGFVFGVLPSGFVVPFSSPHMIVSGWFGILLVLACMAILCSNEPDMVKRTRVITAVLLTWTSFALIGE